MAVSILARRGLGVRQGPDITDPLILTLEVARARGRAELDSATANAQDINLTVRYRPSVLPGQLVEIQDSFQGQNWRGKVVSVRHVADGQALTTQLSVLRAP
jgi:hypothetical protein